MVNSNEGTKVRVTWTEPAYNGGTPLIGYRVKFKTSTGDYVESLAECDGLHQTTKANLFCTVPMQLLRDAPYNLILGD